VDGFLKSETQDKNSHSVNTFTVVNAGSTKKSAKYEDPKHLVSLADIQKDIMPVQFTILDYGWLMKGNTGYQFTEYLAHQPSDSALFKMQNIQTIVNAQWKPFKKQYLKYQFIPFCIYFALIVLFNTLMSPHTFSLGRTLRTDG